MDMKIEIKEEDPLSEDVTSHNEAEFKTNSDVLSLDDDRDMTIKIEIKSETPFPVFCPQKEREFLAQDPVLKVKKYSSGHEMDNKVEVKEEPWWLETETASVKDEDFPPVKSPRLCTEAVFDDSSGKSPLSSVEASGKDTSFYSGKDHPECESQESDVTEIPTVAEHAHSEQSGNCSDKVEIYNRNLYLKQNNLIHKGERPHKFNICERSFTELSQLKLHNFIYDGKKPYKCETCDKNFTRLSSLKLHNLIHEGKKPHKCKACDKSYSQFSHLKLHNLFHEGKRPHHCKTCDKSFTRLSDLKRHNLIHEGKRPHKCKICDKSFTQLSDMKKHTLIHEGKKPHKCEICEKSFTAVSDLKRHYLIHEGKKPHKCETCDKGFSRLSNLKRHNLIH